MGLQGVDRQWLLILVKDVVLKKNGYAYFYRRLCMQGGQQVPGGGAGFLPESDDGGRGVGVCAAA